MFRLIMNSWLLKYALQNKKLYRNPAFLKSTTLRHAVVAALLKKCQVLDSQRPPILSSISNGSMGTQLTNFIQGIALKVFI